LNAPEPPEQVDQALAGLDLALAAVDPDELDSVLEVVDRLTELNQLLAGERVPPEKFEATRLHVDQALVGINSLLTRLVRERDQVGEAISKLSSRAGRLNRLGSPSQQAHSRRLDVST